MSKKTKIELAIENLEAKRAVLALAIQQLREQQGAKPDDLVRRTHKARTVKPETAA